MDENERKKFVQDTFNTVAGGYDSPALRFFRLSAQHMANHLHLNGDEHLLDVATGTGTAALAFAQRLLNGKITAVDFSAGMLAQAAGKAANAGVNNIQFHEMDMSALKFPLASFDAASCAFGIFFVEDMADQLRHIADKVKPGGRTVISGFYDTAFEPLAEKFLNRIEAYGVSVPPLSWKRIGSEDKCLALFQEAGLHDIRVERKDVSYYLKDSQEWWDIIWFAGFRGLVNQIAPERLEEFKQEHLAEIDALATDEGVWLSLEVLYASGMKN